MPTVPLIRIFLSSPGDVNQERKIVLDEIDLLPDLPMFRDKVMIRTIAWDKPGAGTVMRATLTPQEAINKGLPKPADCDIVIVMFWSRMGTPFQMDGEQFMSGTHWELLNALSSDTTETVIYRRTEKKLFDIDDIENQDQYRKVRDFFQSDIFYDASGTIKRGVNQYETFEEFRRNFAINLQELILEQLAKHDGDTIESDEATPADDEYTTTATTRIWDGSPFPGLRAFRESDAPIFFGRGHETDSLIAQLDNSRFVAVVGASGSGKSSLVHAGVIPNLRKNAILGSKDWHIVTLKPDESPFVNLAEALLQLPLDLRLADLLKSPQDIVSRIEEQLTDQPDWVQVLIFIDQFEELFTLTDNDTAKQFAQLLANIADSKRVRAVVTLRHDFFNIVVENQSLAELLRADAVFSLSTPKRDALRQMIERPAERAGLTLEAGLIERILDDTGDEPGNLALMAYALDELYNLDNDKNFTLTKYESLGGVQGAIGIRAENQWEALDLDETVLHRVFQKLIEVDERGTATRQRAIFDNFNETETIFINVFVSARLLTTDAVGTTPTTAHTVGTMPVLSANHQPTTQATIEVAHEAILRQWERLANWIEETQDDHRTMSRMKREAMIWHERGKPDHLRPNAETLQEFMSACENLKATIDDAILQDFTEPEQERLYRELEDINTTHQRRYDIGERLARIGDYRDGIGVKDGLPDLVWLQVAQGGEIEIEGHKFTVDSFFIAKYLTTYEQFQTFLDSDWDNPRWWEGFPDMYQPQQVNNVTNGNSNVPRDTVSWYQCMAFSRWMNEHFQGLELSFDDGESLIVGENAEIRIPTEQEWQWVAQNGAEGRAYP